MIKNIAIGTDIGGSHITCAAIDLLTGKIRNETIIEKAVDNQSGADEIIGIWADALSLVISKAEIINVKGIGFAMPGPFDYVKGICYIRGVAKYENLYGLNIKKEIERRLKLPDDFLIRFMNDASSFAVGEAWTGSAKNFSRSLSITLGTGFGSAFIADKIPVVDGPEVPKNGCIYHIPYKDGIADDYFSTRWFLKNYKSISGKEISGVKELAGIAQSNKIVRDLFFEFGDRIALFLIPWLEKFKAEILIIGGNISLAFNLFGDKLKERLQNENCNVAVALSELKENAALIGSAYLLDDHFWKSVRHALPFM